MTGLDPARTGFTSAAGHVAKVILEKKFPERARPDQKVLTPYEGGTRVPCAVVWPGKTRPGSKTDALLSSSDWYPTLLDMMQIEKPADVRFDGVSQTTTLLGQQGPRESLVCFVPN